MEDECDDDPFDDPFGDALHVSSGLQTTPDSSVIDDESVGGENAVKGVVERVDVRIRGEFLRFKDAREVAICITLSRPPPGPFDLSGLVEGCGVIEHVSHFRHLRGQRARIVKRKNKSHQ